MLENNDLRYFNPNEIGLLPFQESFPWYGGDLQTIRDSFVYNGSLLNKGESIYFQVPSIPSGYFKPGYLIGYLNYRNDIKILKGLVIMIHGLGGSSQRLGVRRMANTLLEDGFCVLRLNLRGASPGRHLVGGTYSAECNTDLIPVLERTKEICKKLSLEITGKDRTIPLFGVGISLGGTILLNSCFDSNSSSLLDGLVCTSSPLDLGSCSLSIERPRNSVYQRWLLRRLVKQTLSDPFGLCEKEKEYLKDIIEKKIFLSSLRQFDSMITAKRWNYKDVEDYYLKASPLYKTSSDLEKLPKTLLLQSLDDPWVPAEGAKKFFEAIRSSKKLHIDVTFTKQGGHNGFHGKNGCWGDELVKCWLNKLWTDSFA